MSSKFLDSMLTKYQAEAAGAAAAAGGPSSYSSQHARMYPYVSAMAAGQPGGFAGVAGYSNALANAAESAAAATAAAAADKNCRYTGSTAAAAASMAEAMVNYSLGAHQNGVGAAAASMAQAAAAGFYQAAASGAAAAAAGVSDPNNPLSACSGQGNPAASLGALAGVHTSGGPDIPRYPWMSITGNMLDGASLYLTHA